MMSSPTSVVRDVCDSNATSDVPKSPASSEDYDMHGDEDETPVSEEQRCKYPGKYCARARACKSNGTYHRFCQYHRTKANTNQKRWTSARRQQAAVEDQHRRVQELVAAGHLTIGTRPLPRPDSAYATTPMPHPVQFEPCRDQGDLSLEDVGILNALLGSEPSYENKQVLHNTTMHPHHSEMNHHHNWYNV